MAKCQAPNTECDCPSTLTKTLVSESWTAKLPHMPHTTQHTPVLPRTSLSSLAPPFPARGPGRDPSSVQPQAAPGFQADYRPTHTPPVSHTSHRIPPPAPPSEDLDENLLVFDTKLRHMREDIAAIEASNNSLELQSRNNSRLAHTLEVRGTEGVPIWVCATARACRSFPSWPTSRIPRPLPPPSFLRRCCLTWCSPRTWRRRWRTRPLLRTGGHRR